VQAHVYRYIEWAWIAVGAVWLTAGPASKKTAHREAATSRLLHIAIMTAALALVFPELPFIGRLPAGPLAARFVPDSSVIACTGLALTVAGCAFAIWARLRLGGNWSGSVTVKQDHRLVRQGPYAIVRHPIYTGFLVGLLGAALALGEWRGIAGLALAFIGWGTKSRIEEAFMTEQFGDEYTGYQREVKALIPFVL